MKKTYTPAEILRWIPDVDHPALNGLRNGVFMPVTIPVTLHNAGQPSLRAEVVLYGHSYSLFTPALAMVLDTMQERGIDVAWDAVSFTAEKRFPRHELEADLTGRTLAAYMRKYRGMDMAQALMDAGKTAMGADHASLQLDEQKQKVADSVLQFCAAVLASGAVVQSADIDRLLSKRGLLSRLLKPFKPKR